MFFLMFFPRNLTLKVGQNLSSKDELLILFYFVIVAVVVVHVFVVIDVFDPKTLPVKCLKSGQIDLILSLCDGGGL